MSNPSPVCEVKDGAGAYTATTNGVTVTASNVITIRLASVAGANFWGLECVGTDETLDADTITALLTIDQSTKTATFTMPAGTGKALIFQSTVGITALGADANGTQQSSYVTTFKVATLTTFGLRTGAINETYENSASFGATGLLNATVRALDSFVPYVTPTGTGFVHITAGAQDAASKLVENADVHASAGIAGTKLSPDFGSQNIVTTGDASAAIVTASTSLKVKNGANTTTITTAASTARAVVFPNEAGNVLISGNASIVNADVHASAAIAGSKISPDFGAQNITTTGDVSCDDITAATSLKVKNGANTTTITTAASASRAIVIPDQAGNALISGNASIVNADISTSAAIAATKLQCDPTINGLRLTLTTAIPVTTSNVTAAGTIYFTPFKSGAIALYDGTTWIMRTTAEISLALTMTSGKNYDVFAYWNGSAVVLELSAAWTTDTSRADAIARQDGVYVKSGTTTRRLVGTIRASAANVTEDSTSKRYVWNMANPVERSLVAVDTTASWTYVSPNGTWRQARSTSTNKVEVVCGEPLPIEIAIQVIAACSNASYAYAAVGVGVDSTTVNSAQLSAGGIPVDDAYGSASVGTAMAQYRGYVSAGYHALNWIESGNNTYTYTFIGQGGSGNVANGGMIGTCES